MNLSWVTGRKQDLQGLLRRRIKPGRYFLFVILHSAGSLRLSWLTDTTVDLPAAPAMSENEIIKAISALDAISAPSNTVVMGPFAIFQVDHASAVAESAGSLPGLVSRHHHGIVCEIDPDSSNAPEPGYSEATASTQDDVPDASEMQEWESTDGYDTLTTPSRVDSNRLRSQRAELLSASRANVAHVSPLPLGLSMPLFRDRETAMLMHHYVNHVSELLQPVLHPQNPWRTTYFPFALEGCPDLFLYQQSVTPSSHASTALFHGLLSAAAFHLRNATGGSTEFHQLGLRHRIKALRSLNGTVIHPSNPQFDVVYLTAMLSLVTIDVSSIHPVPISQHCAI